MILIRTNLNVLVGLGHYKRMLRLARELKKFQKKVIILLDKPNLEFESKEFKHFYLYETKKYQGEILDAKKTNEFIITNRITKVIVDDYRLGFKWEKIVKTTKIKLTVFDDLNKKNHCCDLYVNFKLLSKKEKEKINQNLENKTNLLIGPKYSILNKLLIKKKLHTPYFNITFYAGGGGDPKIFYKLVKNLCLKIDTNTKINLIVSLNKNYLNKYLAIKKKYSNFNIYFKEKYLEIMSKTNLYIGPQGNAIYENSYLKKLSIFFPIADNQINDVSKLNLLGHYFIIKKENLVNYLNIIKLIKNIQKNFSHISKQSFNKVNLVDSSGTLRIARSIIGKKIKIDEKKLKKLNKKFQIQKINLDDMHQYLEARNLKVNRIKMLNFKKINLIDHYNWWLSNEFKTRATFKVCSENKTLLFIWHKLIKINNCKYLIGGWFVNSSFCKISDILIALKWQLKITKKKNIKWIAIINKKNNVVLKLNKLLGFSTEFLKEKDFLSAKSYFKASTKNFNYFIL